MASATKRDLYLAIDVGTGSIRAALVDQTGRILAFDQKEHEQIVPQHGWSEQRPADWWQGTVESVQGVLAKTDNAASRVAAICACGQMHGSVLIDDDGNLTRDSALLWNDKRTAPQVAGFSDRISLESYFSITANAPAPAWPAFKLAWLTDNDLASIDRASTLLMPKDWINFKLTGERAQDITEASLSFLMDWKTRAWSDAMIEMTGVPARLLPPLHPPQDLLAGLTEEAAGLTRLPEGLPVLVGAGDYPMALLGSGAIGAGMGSDVTGTSTIITLMHEEPTFDEAVSNVLSAAGDWGSFTLLDAGGDAVRWARRAFHDNRRSYADVAEAATEASAGSQSLFFLPYLSGERFGSGSPARAQFFGLTANHGLPELHRAVLEGVAFSVRHRMDRLQGGHGRPEQIIASSGGAKSRLWLEIKASMYRTPYRVPEELECGVVGAAILMAVATGQETDLKTAVDRMVRLGPPIEPHGATADLYDRMMPVYTGLYEAAQPFYAQLDAL
ncbi:MAG: FGGY-family carbohydrate kinase [Cohaesibacteraceae bacterium]